MKVRIARRTPCVCNKHDADRRFQIVGGRCVETINLTDGVEERDSWKDL